MEAVRSILPYWNALIRWGTLIFLMVMFVPYQAGRATGTVLYAAPAAQGSGDCLSWANACTLQTARTNAVSGDEIWVKAGVHYPGSTRDATFGLKNGVALYGGFAGTETQRNQRNWQTNKTILSGDIDTNDINTDGNNIAETTTDIQGNNAYHVVTAGGNNSTAVLDGFVITAGKANVSWPENIGGGIYNNNSSPTLTNLAFSGNYATLYGGGLYNYTGSPTLTNVTFSGNSTMSQGGGMYNGTGSPTLTNVTFSSNTASDGGGLYNFDSSPTLINITFSSNSATNDGGGMSNEGVIGHVTTSPTLTNVTFSGNTVPTGGGMLNKANTNPTLTNVTFSGNTASSGGGMWNDSSPTLTNVTFSGNSASTGGGGIVNFGSPTLTNVIFWGDSAAMGSEIYNGNSIAISYSDIQGCGGSGAGWQSACGTDGGGNIDADPLFVDSAGGDLRLSLGSPAIDSGTNTGCPTTDLDGMLRPTDGNGDSTATCDMGAYEYQPNKIYLPLILKLTP